MSSLNKSKDSCLTDVLATSLAVLGVERLEAATAVRAAVLHDVPLAPQHGLALVAGKVLHVPVASLGLRALVRQDDLRTTRVSV